MVKAFFENILVTLLQNHPYQSLPHLGDYNDFVQKLEFSRNGYGDDGVGDCGGDVCKCKIRNSEDFASQKHPTAQCMVEINFYLGQDGGGDGDVDDGGDGNS